MIGLFLRYCADCNTTTPTSDAAGKCGSCGATLKIVDAHALIVALGEETTPSSRQEAFERCKGHDLP